MNVLLINYCDKSMKITEPLGICYLAASLRKYNHNVLLVDSRINEYDLDDFCKYVCDISDEYEIIGISTSQHFGHSAIESPAVQIIKNLRECSYKGHISIGGYGPSLDWKTYIQLGPDSVIIGEGEKIISNLAEALQDNKEWRNIRGIVYINNDGNIVRNENEDVMPLDEIEAPSRDILFEFAKKYGVKHVSTSIQGSRGCYMNCAYCSTPVFMKNQGGPVYRTRKIKNLVNEIEFLYNKGFDNLDFIDDNFLPPNKGEALKRAEELRNELRDRNIHITFFMEFRLEYISKEILEILKEAGLRRLFIGIESFNEEDLKLYNRTYSEKKIHKAIETVLEVGFSPKLNSEYRFRYGFINVNPLSTTKTLRNSGQYFKKYGFTYKKLCKKLALYDNNLSILKNVYKEYPEYTNEKYFKDERVSLYYSLYSNYSENYVKLRNKGRNYEKYIVKEIRAGNQNEDLPIMLGKLEDMRKKLDDGVFITYMEGLDKAEKEDYVKELNMFFDERNRLFLESKEEYEEILLHASQIVGNTYGYMEKFY